MAIVGSESLLGRELRDLLSNQRLSEQVVFVAEGNEDERLLSEQEGDPVFLSPLNRETLEATQLVFLAGSSSAARKVGQMGLTATLVDATGVLNGTIRAPFAEPERYLAPEARVVTVAHPAAIALGFFLRRLSGIVPVKHAVATIFEPASQRGKAAIDELQEQTVGLLSFRPVPKTVFDEQLSFNLLSRLGAEAPEPLNGAESRIERDLQHLLSLDKCAALPSLRLIHAPVFHSYAISIWAELESEPDLETLTAGLKSPALEIRSPDEDAPTNVGVAGQSGITLDVIVPDARKPTAVWFWLMADNIRLIAENALLTAASILEQAGRRVQ